MNRYLNWMKRAVFNDTGSESALNATKCILLAALFSLMQLIGRDLKADNKINYSLLKGVVLFSLCFCISLAAAAVCTGIFEKAVVIFNKTDESCHGRPFSIKEYVLLNVRNLMFWMPYYILFFPGTSNNGDTEKQLRMFFHREGIGFPLNVSPIQGPDIFITDHHPVFTTWLYGSFVKLGLLLGSASIGVAIFSFLQMICFSLALTWIWARLPQLGVDRKFIKAGTWFTALFPYYPIMSLCMVKDVTFSFFCILLMLFLFELRASGGELWKKRWFTPSLTLVVLFFILSKGQGKYLAAVLFLILLFAYRKHWKELLIAFVVPILFVQTIWVNVLFPLWNVSPGGKQETLGPLFQQTARYAATYADEVTEEEKDAISAVLDYDKLAELYNPELTDPVKLTFNQSATDEQLKDYYKAWFFMLMKHPGVYFAATLNTSYKFFDITWKELPIFTRFFSRVEETDELYIKSYFTGGELNKIVRKLFLLLQYIPVIGLIFRPSFYTWLTVFCFLTALRKNGLKQIGSVSLPFFSVLIYFACPGNLARYTIPIILMTAIMLVSTLYRES